MTEVTRILTALEQGNAQAAEQLLPLVYAELRKLAAQRLAQEKPGQTLDPTALVHEAYLRLATPASPGASSARQEPNWNSRGHFFAAAAEAMRRILIEKARRKGAVKHGGSRRRVELGHIDPVKASATTLPPDDLLALNGALEKFARKDPRKAELVKLRFFAGLTMPEAAKMLGVSLATAERYWTYARAWLFAELQDASSKAPSKARDHGKERRSDC